MMNIFRKKQQEHLHSITQVLMRKIALLSIETGDLCTAWEQVFAGGG